MHVSRIVKTGLQARDDRVLPITRVVGAIVAIVLFLAFLTLYWFPGSTDVYFAWTIAPNLTPIVMGAGYGAGTYFFIRVITVGEWHRVHVLFPGIAVFTWAMAIATVMHWDLFNHGHVSTVVWVVLYVVTPVLIPAIWLLNRRTDAHRTPDGQPFVPDAVRWVSGILGVGLTLVIAILFANPEPMINAWPWAVSPLTSRVVLGWAGVFSVVNIFFALERRWSAAKIPIQSLGVWFALILVGFLRSWDDIDPTNPLTWLLIGGMIGYLAFVTILYAFLDRS